MDKANIPHAWLMTDERMGDALFEAIERLPTGAGVVFRHHSLVLGERRALARRVARQCQARALLLSVSRDVGLAREVGAALVHNPAADPGNLPHSRSVHSVGEAGAAAEADADLAFVSPLFATRSHPGAPVLHKQSVAAILDQLNCPAIALGGMDAERFAEVADLGFHGWAGIDAWLRI